MCKHISFCCHFETIMFKRVDLSSFMRWVFTENWTSWDVYWILCECYEKDFFSCVFLLWYNNSMTHFNQHKQACADFLYTHVHTNLDMRIWTLRELASTNSSLHMTQLEAMDHLATVEEGCLIYQQSSHHFKRLSIHMQCGLLSSCTLFYLCMHSMWSKPLQTEIAT